MDLEIDVDRARCSTKGLGDDLAPIQTSPRILRPNSDERIRPVRLEIEQSAEIHRRKGNYWNAGLRNYDGGMAKRGPKGPMTDEHKAALATGRNEGNAVRNYLEALRNNKPKRGRRRTRESIASRLDAIDAELESADPMTELRLRQERRDLQAESASMGDKVDITALENGFVSVARAYSARQGISYATWREIGVDAAVLKRAGISRGE